MNPESEDLLGKADALMARHRPGRAGAEAYAQIPVLEEVVDLAPEDDGVPLLTEVVEPDSAAPRLADQALLREEQVAALAQSRRASLLEALQAEIDIRIEEHLKALLEPVVEKLFEDLRTELQSIARESLSKAIDSALAHEVERNQPGADREGNRQEQANAQSRW
jgi:hypothetical protein